MNNCRPNSRESLDRGSRWPGFGVTENNTEILVQNMNSSDPNMLSDSSSRQSSRQDSQRRNFASSETGDKLPRPPSSHNSDRNIVRSISVGSQAAAPFQVTPYQQQPFPLRQQYYPADQGLMRTNSNHGIPFFQSPLRNNSNLYGPLSRSQNDQTQGLHVYQSNQYLQTHDNESRAHANTDSMHPRYIGRNQPPSLPYEYYRNNEEIVTPDSASRLGGRNLFMHNRSTQNSPDFRTPVNCKSTKRSRQELLSESPEKKSHSHNSLPSEVGLNEGNKDSITNEQRIICRCVKSRCIKLYCDCFQNGSLCHSLCECTGCVNNEAEMGKCGKLTIAKKSYLSRKPEVFGKKKKIVGAGCACKNNR